MEQNRLDSEKCNAYLSIYLEAEKISQLPLFQHVDSWIIYIKEQSRSCCELLDSLHDICPEFIESLEDSSEFDVSSTIPKQNPPYTSRYLIWLEVLDVLIAICSGNEVCNYFTAVPRQKTVQYQKEYTEVTYSFIEDVMDSIGRVLVIPQDCLAGFTKDVLIRDIANAINSDDKKFVAEVNKCLDGRESKNADEKQPADQGNGKTNKKKTKSKSAIQKDKLSTKYLPWTNSGDACFIIDGNRIKFHYQEESKDLKLRSNSKTLNFLVLLNEGSLQANEIKEQLSPNTTNKAGKIVVYANKLLNEKIAIVGFVGIPSNVEFIKRGGFGQYELCYKISEKEEFTYLQPEEEIIDDR